MVACQGIKKSFADVLALADTDLVFARGQTTVLIGQSGCGKSTLLRLLIGLITPDAGTVHIDGQEVSKKTVGALRQKIGYVIQDGGLFPHLTALGNVTLMAQHLAWTPGRIAARVAQLCELTRFPTGGLSRFPTELSGGQRQRVSLMRALMLDPSLLLLDEPLGALDPMIRADLQDDLKVIFQKLQKTVIMVTHDIAEAGFFADTIIVMHEGKVEKTGTLAELLEVPPDSYVARFIKAQRLPLNAKGVGQ